MKLRAMLSSIVIVTGITGTAVAQTPPPAAPVVSAPVAPPTPTAVAPVATAPVAAAPAAAPAATSSDWMNYQAPYTGEQNVLLNPHRTPDEILAWSQNSIAESLSYTPANFNARLMTIKQTFSPEGWAQYVAWVQSVKIDNSVRAMGLSVNAVVKTDISIINNGPVSGAYRWLVQAPIIVSLVKEIEGEDGETLYTKNYRVTIQVGRTNKAGNEDGLLIESWKAEDTK